MKKWHVNPDESGIPEALLAKDPSSCAPCLLDWHDTVSDDSWNEHEDGPSECTVRSEGHYLGADSSWAYMGRDHDGNVWGGSMRVPRGCVIALTLMIPDEVRMGAAQYDFFDELEIV